MTSRNILFVAVHFLTEGLLFCLAAALASLLAVGCDVMPPSPRIEAPMTTEPQPVLQTTPSPWDVTWVPEDSQAGASRIDSILEDAGLSGHGGTILEYAREYGVNPAFALAMFRKEAEFATQGSIAQRQNNPGNIICGGGTTPLYGATGCGGRFGIYDAMADGIRAYFWLLDSEYKPGRKYDCVDIPCIINVYCPPSDCDTARYVEQVVEWTIQYQSLLSTEGPLVLEPGPTVPSTVGTVVPATMVPLGPTGVASPTTTPVPTGGRIAFSSLRDGNYEIYVVSPDDTGLSRLTTNPAQDMYPAWSPDAGRIAFVSDRDGNWEIYLMNADGSRVTRLTTNPAQDRYPCWSPDGRHIAFASDRDGNHEIYVVNTDGTGLCNLTNHPASDTSPSWSPDGTRIAFSSYRPIVGEVYVMNADGSGQRNLQRNLTNHQYYGLDPSWSPDGEHIAFAASRESDYEIFVMNADGSRQRNLTNNPSYDLEPSWSPDGEHIAFSSKRDGNYGIFVMNADGSGVMRLARGLSTDSSPAWSPR